MPELIGKLGYDGSGWTAGMAQAVGEANKASKVMAGHFADAFSGNLLGNAIQKGFAAAGLAGVGTLVERLAEGMQEKFKEIKIGADLLQVDPQTFQKVANVTNAKGSSPEAVAKAMQQIAVAQQKIAEGSEGADKLTAGFATLGVSLQDLQSQNYQQIFFKIADAMKDAEISGERLNAIHEILGRSGQQLIPSFKAGFDSALANRGLLDDSDLKRLDEIRSASAQTAGFWKSISNEAGMWAASLWQGLKGLTPGLLSIYGEMTGLGPEKPNEFSPEQKAAAAEIRERDAARIKADNEKAMAAQRDAAAASAKEKKDEQLRKERDKLNERYQEEREKVELESLKPAERKQRLQELLNSEKTQFADKEKALNADAGNLPLQMDALKQGLRIFSLQKELLSLDKQHTPRGERTQFDALARIGGFTQRDGANQDIQTRMLTAAERTAQGVTQLANEQ